MTKADKLRALIPAVTGLYWRAKGHHQEHAALVVYHALISDKPFPYPELQADCSRCRDCAIMTASQFVAMADGLVVPREAIERAVGITA